MRLSLGRIATLLLTVLFLLPLATDRVSTASTPPPPNPVLVYIGQEPYQANGKNWVRYKYFVFNKAEYPNTMFAASPNLPPCGKNTKASRTWVDIYDQNGKRLYGFCALGSNNDLDKLWFALEEGVLPPSWIYIEMNDRQTSTKYKSNLAPTTD